MYTPPGYDAAQPLPLVVVLHGYGATGEIMESVLGLRAAADRFNLLYIAPNGQLDAVNNRYWNATDACCDVFLTETDDSGYLRRTIEQIQQQYSVDPQRIFVLGHSNGGFMSHRLACDHADLIAGIVSVSGATYADPKRCLPSDPINVLQIHGDADEIIHYQGGQTFEGSFYPSAPTTVMRWAHHNKCAQATEAGPSYDLLANIAGNETRAERYSKGCKPGGDVQLWTMQGGRHIPQVSDEFVPTIVDYMLKHPKP